MTVPRRCVGAARPSFAVFLGVTFALSALSLLAEHLPGRFVPAATLEPSPPAPAAAPGRWHLYGRGASLRRGARPELPELIIESGSRYPFPHATRVLADLAGARYLRVTAEVRTEALVRGEGAGAGLVLLSYDARHRRLGYWPYAVVDLDGTTRWRRTQTVLPVSREAARMVLVAYGAGLSGTLAVRDVHVEAMAERPAVGALRLGLVVLWGITGVWMLLAVLGRERLGPLRAASVGAAGVALVLGIIPQPHLNDLLKLVIVRSQDVYFASAEALSEGAPEPPSRPPARVPPDDRPGGRPETASGGGAAAPGSASSAPARPPPRRYWFPDWEDKDAHLAGFLGLTVLTGLAYRARPARAIGAMVGLAVAIQSLQSFLVTRDSDVADLLADLTGIAAGVVLLAALRAVGRLRARLGPTRS